MIRIDIVHEIAKKGSLLYFFFHRFLSLSHAFFFSSYHIAAGPPFNQFNDLLGHFNDSVILALTNQKRKKREKKSDIVTLNRF